MSNDEPLAIVTSDGVNEDSPQAITLEFVNVGAVSQAEKERNQKVIRSTAMRAFRRRQQSERLLKDDGKSKCIASRPKIHHSRTNKDSQSDGQQTSPISNTDLSPDISFSEPTFSEVSWLMSGPSNDRKADYFAFVESNRSGSLSSQSSQAPVVVDSPITLLGAGRVDPFRILPVDTGSHINELIDHCELQFSLPRSFRVVCVDSLI
jgi:hypothetical protein